MSKINCENWKERGQIFFPHPDRNFLTKLESFDSVPKDQNALSNIFHNCEIDYVPLENQFMKAARTVCEELSRCSYWPTGAVITVTEDDIEKIVSRGANSGKKYVIPCPRYLGKYPSGEGYHHCQNDCGQHGHSEVTSTGNLNLDEVDKDLKLYLYGHWWCCENCWSHMIGNGIHKVYLLEGADKIFTRDNRNALQEKFILEKENGHTEFQTDDFKWIIK